jgi:hypothetical protein
MSKQPSTFMKFISISPLVLGPIIAYNAIKLALYNKQIHTLLSPHIPEVWNFEAKITSLVFISIFISVFVALCVFGTILGRYITTSPNPLMKQDPPMILFFNRVLLNTLEQTAIFFPLLAYWTLKYSNESNKHEVFIFGLVWVLSRLLYVIGYGFNFINKNLSLFRVFGFQIGFFIAPIIALRLFGKNIV